MAGHNIGGLFDGQWTADVQDDNWRWSQYRANGIIPARGSNIPASALYVTPFPRNPNQPPPVLTGIERTLNGYQANLLAGPAAGGGGNTLTLGQIRRTRRFFERRPRFNYRRLLGVGGMGAAFKMTYQSPNVNLPNIDFVLKTDKDGPTYSEEIRKEAKMMEGFQEPDVDDSSDDPDADSSGDESVDGPPPPKPQRRLRSDALRTQKHAAHDRIYQDWDARDDARNARADEINKTPKGQNPPAENPNYPDAGLELYRRDFIFMEYLPLGDLQEVIFKIVADDPDQLIPNEILWSFWLCTYPPRKFAQGRDRATGQKRKTMDQDLAGLGIGPHDASQVLLEDLPHPRKRWRNQRIVHFDIDITNRPAQYPYRVQADNNSEALPPNVVPPLGEPVIPPDYNIDMPNAVGKYDEASEHELIPALKEQFCPDWDYLPQSRDGDDIAREPVGDENIIPEPVAGKYGSHTNVWQIALPPAPPRLVTVEIFRRRATQSYAVNLDAAEYSEVDRELRQTIVNCLKHNPKDRPTLEALLDQAKKAVGRRRRDATAGEIRGWVQRYVYDA
ncbi:hypothetical protein PG996_012301 [Apiospora saccharicola]|uniref:Protein kinase domain-containing protein n=1 Tax=Apiospora saccharicola TaxID=335842 RepID=A0ABR1U4K0_9PEZI